jgi:hypothetical protein
MGAAPWDVARIAMLDIGAGLIALGAVRNEPELLAWLRLELPERVAQLDRALTFSGVPPASPRSAPALAAWN